MQRLLSSTEGQSGCSRIVSVKATLWFHSSCSQTGIKSCLVLHSKRPVDFYRQSMWHKAGGGVAECHAMNCHAASGMVDTVRQNLLLCCARIGISIDEGRQWGGNIGYKPLLFPAWVAPRLSSTRCNAARILQMLQTSQVSTFGFLLWVTHFPLFSIWTAQR